MGGGDKEGLSKGVQLCSLAMRVCKTALHNTACTTNSSSPARSNGHCSELSQPACPCPSPGSRVVSHPSVDGGVVDGGAGVVLDEVLALLRSPLGCGQVAQRERQHMDAAWLWLARKAWTAEGTWKRGTPRRTHSPLHFAAQRILRQPSVHCSLTVRLAGVCGVLAAAEEALLAGGHQVVGVNLRGKEKKRKAARSSVSNMDAVHEAASSGLHALPMHSPLQAFHAAMR